MNSCAALSVRTEPSRARERADREHAEPSEHERPGRETRKARRTAQLLQPSGVNAPRSSFGTRRRRRSHLCRKGSAQLDLPRAHEDALGGIVDHGRRLPLQRRPARRAVRRAAPERVCRIRSPRELREQRPRELARNGASGSVGRPERRRVPLHPRAPRRWRRVPLISSLTGDGRHAGFRRSSSLAVWSRATAS